ncbi:MAG TPA: hypothetical protein PKL31_04415 [Fulvivirga sp.]|nr:hypothetical protein [Fulvivirga sp.]
MRSLPIYLFLLTVCFACDISDNTVDPTTAFFKIYDNNQFDASYIPIDIKQTSDGGYIILSSKRIETSNFTGVNLIKIDNKGEFVNQQEIEDQYVNAVDQLIKVNDTFQFLAMDATSLQAVLFTVNDSANITSTIPIAGLTYPMYVADNDTELLVLSYNNNDKTSVLSLVSNDGTVGTSRGYTIGAGADTEAPIIEHFTRTGKQLPFFAGKTSNNTYFFNGFYNYTLSLVFTNFGDEPQGVVQGQQDDGGLSAAISLNGGTFAISRFNFGNNYIVPSVDLSTSGISSATDFPGNAFPELVADAPVVVDVINANGKEAIIYGSNTKSGQIILMAYSSSTGALLGTKYLGSTYPYQVAGFTLTEDQGLAVVGNTSVAGRFDRICLFKLSAEELGGLIK